MESILDHYHAKLAEQNMSEAEVIGERNTNGHLERYSYYICLLIILYMCPRLKMCLDATICALILVYMCSQVKVCGDTRAARVLRPPLRQDERVAPSHGLVLYVVSHDMQ